MARHLCRSRATLRLDRLLEVRARSAERAPLRAECPELKQARYEILVGVVRCSRAFVGLATNKFLAKMVIDISKTKGFHIVTSGRECGFLQDLPVSSLGRWPKKTSNCFITSALFALARSQLGSSTRSPPRRALWVNIFTVLVEAKASSGPDLPLEEEPKGGLLPQCLVVAKDQFPCLSPWIPPSIELRSMLWSWVFPNWLSSREQAQKHPMDKERSE